MPRVFRRETFIALRACRAAYHIAAKIVNPRVELTALPCPTCGHDVPVSRRRAAAQCAACGAVLRLSASDCPKDAKFVAELVDDAQPRQPDMFANDTPLWILFLATTFMLLWGLFVVGMTFLNR